MRRRWYLIGGGALLLLALVVTVVLVFAGGDEQAGPGRRRTSTTSTSTTEPAVRAPLTGLPVDDPSILDRPALIVKIDNADSYSRPQAGINQADVVYEEKVEGGVTRFASVFHSKDAPLVGPVRSARSTDVNIASALEHPLFSFSGANTVFLALIRAAPLVELSYDYHPELYTRRADRPAPDDIFTPTDTIRTATPDDARPPEALFVYRRSGDDLPPGAEKVSGVTWSTGGAGAPVAFTWDRAKHRWLREQNGTPHVDEDGIQIGPANVIVQFVDYIDTGLIDLAGTPVPEAELIGEGEAWVFTDGHLVRGRWKKSAPDEATAYVDAAGEPIALTPGQTWVGLIPTGAAQVTP